MKRVGRYIGFVIFALIVVKVDWNHFGGILEQAHTKLIYTALILNIPLIWIKSMRWRLLLSWQGFRLGAWDAFLYYSSSLYLGAIAPGCIGELGKVL